MSGAGSLPAEGQPRHALCTLFSLVDLPGNFHICLVLSPLLLPKDGQSLPLQAPMKPRFPPAGHPGPCQGTRSNGEHSQLIRFSVRFDCQPVGLPIPKKMVVTIPLASEECILIKYCRHFFFLKHYLMLSLYAGIAGTLGFSSISIKVCT